MKLLSRARLFATPWIVVACTKLLRPWDFQGKSTAVGCHFLLQGIFPTQGSNPDLSHCRQTHYYLSHQGSPRVPKWVAIPFCRVSSQPRDWTLVSCIAGIVLLLLLLSHFSRVRLCATPETAAHQAPPSLGFSRQEHWSGLPFPSPMHESEKWKWSLSVVSNPQQPHEPQPFMGFSRQEYWSGVPLPS